MLLGVYTLTSGALADAEMSIDTFHGYRELPVSVDTAEEVSRSATSTDGQLLYDYKIIHAY